MTAVAAPADRSLRLGLGIACGLAAVLRLPDALSRPVDYNGYWHVFIARNLLREWRNLQHPPLFLILLKGADLLWPRPLGFRLVSLVSGVVAVFLVGRILEKLDATPAASFLAALALALSANAIALSSLVESYALAVALVLGSFFFAVDVVRADPEPSTRSRAAFAALASLALAAHYFAALFLAAAALAPCVAAALRPAYRRAMRTTLPLRWRRDALTLLPPAATGLFLYETQAKRWVMPLSSLPSFYFRPHAETMSVFLVRNLRETFDLFAPFWMPRARTALPALALVLVVLLWAALTESPARRDRIERLLPALVLALLLSITMVLGVLGKYPFGGMMRHQFLLFLFAVLAGGVALDRAMRSARARWRMPIVAVSVAVLAAAFALRSPDRAGLGPETLRQRMGAFSMEVPDGATVLVDGFNLIGLFAATADGVWSFEGRDPKDPSVETYMVRRGGRRFSVVALRRWWIFDFRAEAFYADLRRNLIRGIEACPTVRSVSGTVFDTVRATPVGAERDRLARQIARAAARQGLSVEQLRLSEFLDVSLVVCRPRGGI